MALPGRFVRNRHHHSAGWLCYLYAASSAFFLAFVFTLWGCSSGRTAPTNKPEAAKIPEIREISLMSGNEVTYTTGNGHSDTVTFRSNGTAEMRSEITEKLTQRPPVLKRAQVSKDQFEQLAKVIAENGFFDKKENEGHVEDAWQNLKVITSDGERTLETFGRNGDPQIRAMIDAVNDLSGKLQWQEVK